MILVCAANISMFSLYRFQKLEDEYKNPFQKNIYQNKFIV